MTDAEMMQHVGSIRQALRHPLQTARNIRIKQVHNARHIGYRMFKAGARPRKLGGILLYGCPLFQAAKVSLIGAGYEPERAEVMAVRITLPILTAIAVVVGGLVLYPKFRVGQEKQVAAAILKSSDKLSQDIMNVPSVTSLDRAASMSQVQQACQALIDLQQQQSVVVFENPLKVIASFQQAAPEVLAMCIRDIQAGKTLAQGARDRISPDNPILAVMSQMEKDFMAEGLDEEDVEEIVPEFESEDWFSIPLTKTPGYTKICTLYTKEVRRVSMRPRYVWGYNISINKDRFSRNSRPLIDATVECSEVELDIDIKYKWNNLPRARWEAFNLARQQVVRAIKNVEEFYSSHNARFRSSTAEDLDVLENTRIQISDASASKIYPDKIYPELLSSFERGRLDV
jgi:hypothetical protein